jgi:hypothetical protein
VGLLDEPIEYHPAREFDWTRTQAEFVGTDDAGWFVWICAIVTPAARVC